MGRNDVGVIVIVVWFRRPQTYGPVLPIHKRFNALMGTTMAVE